MIARKDASNLKVGLAVALGAATFVAAAWSAIGVSAPTSPFAPGLAVVNEARANAALRPGGDLAEAERESRWALEGAPADASSWARLAYAERRQSRNLTPDAQHALEMSYFVAPLGPDISRWRLRFMLDNWGALTPSLRQLTLRELRNFAHYHPGSADLARRTRDPVARLAATMTVRMGYSDARREIGEDPESSAFGVKKGQSR